MKLSDSRLRSETLYWIVCPKNSDPKANGDLVSRRWAVLDDLWKHHIRFIWKKKDGSRENPQALYVFELATEDMSRQPHDPPPNPFERWKPILSI